MFQTSHHDTCGMLLEMGIPIGVDTGELRRRLREEFPVPDDPIQDFSLRFLDRADALVSQPCDLAACFRKYFGIYETPKLRAVLLFLLLLGIEPRPVDYLPSGATSMYVGGVWHIHYSAKDPPATQKFSLFHEVFEILVKTFQSLKHSCCSRLKDPELSRRADRFAAGVLTPPDFFIRKMNISGLDATRLAGELELSQQTLLIAFKERLRIPFIAALYEYEPPLEEFAAKLVVKTSQARYISRLCSSQMIPVKGESATPGSLVCLAVSFGLSVICRPRATPQCKDTASKFATLVRPFPWHRRDPGRAILLSVPDCRFDLIKSQAERLPLLEVDYNMPMACDTDGGMWKCPTCRYESILINI